jgi:hypothetical protein
VTGPQTRKCPHELAKAHNHPGTIWCENRAPWAYFERGSAAINYYVISSKVPLLSPTMYICAWHREELAVLCSHLGKDFHRAECIGSCGTIPMLCIAVAPVNRTRPATLSGTSGCVGYQDGQKRPIVSHFQAFHPFV